jgi:Tol biopolymer transport system component
MNIKTNCIQNTLAAVFTLSIMFGSPTVRVAAQTSRVIFTAPVTVKLQKGSSTFSQIFSMDQDGNALTQLTTGTASTFVPKWSPDQQHVAYIRGNNLTVMNANGSGGFVAAPDASSAGGIDWSPDGSKLLYTGLTDNLYIVSVDPISGTAGTPTIFLPGPSYDPSWSPDGTMVAFDRYPCDCQSVSSIFVYDLVSGSEFNFSQAVNVNGISNAWGPKWSPDGTRLAFKGTVSVTTPTRKGTTTWTYREFFIAKADGSGLFQVTPNTMQIGNTPAWSPDGSALLVVSSSNIYRTVLGSGIFNLLTVGAQPDWAP